MSTIHNDEPTSEDKLNRSQYATAFARLSETCDTPLVIGLYATWGVGKTSLMKQIEKKLDPKKTRVIWFNLWEHQFAENPVVAMAHVLADSLNQKKKERGKKLLTVIASAFGSRLLQFTTGLKVLEILKLGQIYEEERFQSREACLRLREHFKNLVEDVKNDEGVPKRLVFFIDDLDRCMPEEALKLLEALKQYLNIEGCIYFLGVDRHTLEQGIACRYKDLQVKEVDYLDKIIQLPFTVPLIEPTCMDSFIRPLLSEDLQPCSEILVKGLDSNPRQIKRFVNVLLLNHHLAKETLPNYQPLVLATLLLIQYRYPDLYRRVTTQPMLLNKLTQDNEESAALRETQLVGNDYLVQLLKNGSLPNMEELKPYIYLADATRIQDDRATQDEQGFYSEESFEYILATSGLLNFDEIILDNILLFKTKKQQTWLIITNKQIICVLDDENTRKGDELIQWTQPLDGANPVRVYISSNGNPVFDIGTVERWLYSKTLHPDPIELEKKLKSMIQNAKGNQNITPYSSISSEKCEANAD